LQDGDTLETQGGLAEIEFENGATTYLAENSVLQFTQLASSGGGRITQLNLTQARALFTPISPGKTRFEWSHRPSRPRSRSAPSFALTLSATARPIQVFLGEVSVTTSAGSTTFEKGQSGRDP